MTLTYVKTNKNVAFYQAPGLKGSVRFLTSQFAGNPPSEIEIEAEGLAQPKAPKVKETKEARAARLAAMTPDEKRQAEVARIAEQKARIAKREAALGL